MWDFIKSNKFKILLCIIALLFGMIIYSASSDGIENIPKNLLQMVTTPFQKVSTYITTNVGGFFGQFANASETADENEKLKDEVSDLNKKLIEYEKLKSENEQLREIAGIKETNPDLTLAPASVVSRDVTDQYSTFVIDKGSLDGIAVGDPVMTKQGLVGVIIEVGTISSKVRTILFPDINVSCIGITSKDLGVVTGDFELSEKGYTKMSILAESTTLKQGELISTAGAGGLYPADLPIGTVESIQNETHGMSKYAKIKPFVSVTELDSVYIVTSFKGQGSEILDGSAK